jgi:hypothetical protein
MVSFSPNALGSAFYGPHRLWQIMVDCIVYCREQIKHDLGELTCEIGFHGLFFVYISIAAVRLLLCIWLGLN